MNDEAAFVNDHLEPTDDFDWGIVESNEIHTVDSEIRRQCALALAKFSRRLLENGGRNRNQFFIAANCFAFAAQIHPNQNKSMEEIAHSIGMKGRAAKAAFCKRVNKCRDILKLPRIAGARSDAARKKFQQTTKKHHEQKTKTVETKTSRDFLAGFKGEDQRPGKAD